jgi:hypothetical protein
MTAADGMADTWELAAIARRRWPDLIDDCLTMEDIGRAPVRRASSGPPHWSGLRILRAVGVLIEPKTQGFQA